MENSAVHELNARRTFWEEHVPGISFDRGHGRAICPFCHGELPLMVNLFDNEFRCGSCGKRGGQTELLNELAGQKESSPEVGVQEKSVATTAPMQQPAALAPEARPEMVGVEIPAGPEAAESTETADRGTSSVEAEPIKDLDIKTHGEIFRRREVLDGYLRFILTARPTLHQNRVLAALLLNPDGLSNGQLSELTNINAANVSRATRTLIGQKIVIRRDKTFCLTGHWPAYEGA